MSIMLKSIGCVKAADCNSMLNAAGRLSGKCCSVARAAMSAASNDGDKASAGKGQEYVEVGKAAKAAGV